MRAVLGGADDPFRLAVLMPGEHERLAEEASAIAMLGGRRVVRVRGAGDELTAAVAALAGQPGDSLVVIEAPGLAGRSRLATLVQASPVGAAIAFYPEEAAALRATIARLLAESGVGAEAAALDWLREHLGGDAAQVRNEVEKLALYAGAGGRLTLGEVMEAVGDAGQVSLEEAAFAVLAGEAAVADRALERALAEGASPVAVLRVLAGQVLRLHLARGRVEAGEAAAAAIKALRPPVFWKREAAMVEAVRRWGVGRLQAALAEIGRAELACKQTGAPELAIVRRLVLVLARQARAAPR